MLTRSCRIVPLASAMFASAMVLTVSGCNGGSLSLNFHDPHPVHVTRVYAPPRHVCGYDCHEHYREHGRIVVLKGHRHSDSCGHFWDGSHWVVAVKKQKGKRFHSPKKKLVKVKHMHGPSCGCVYHPHKHKWIKVRTGHVHRHGCGHRYVEGRWTIRF